MEHGLYLKIEKITEKLANEKGCMIKDPENCPEEKKKAMVSDKIPFGKDKGKLEYYDLMQIMEFCDFLKRCYEILPRDDLEKLIGAKKTQYRSGTGVTMDTLLSDKPCSEEERENQKLIIFRFFNFSAIRSRIYR